MINDTLFNNCEMQDLLIDQRELIMKILARYTTKYSVFRELVQNSDDAGSTELIIEVKGRSLIFKNNGKLFTDDDWTRIRTVAKGNPEDNTVGCFGVGFYSVFSITQEPVIVSGNKSIQFVFIGDQLKIKTINTANIDTWTKFIFTNITDESIFEYDNLKAYFTEVLKYTNNIVKISLFINDDLYSTSNKQMVKQLSIASNEPHGGNMIDFKLRTIDVYNMSLHENTKIENYIFIDSSFSVEFSTDYLTEIKALLTKKLPRKTSIKLLYPDKSIDFINSLDITKPVKDMYSGHIYIGYKTQQTTGYGFDMNAQFIPTVERESIDLNSRMISNWNRMLLTYGGLVANIYYKQCIERNIQNITFATLLYSYQESVPVKEIGSIINSIFINHYDHMILTTSGIVSSCNILVDNSYNLDKLENSTNLIKIPYVDIDHYKRIDSKSLYEQLFSTQRYTKINLDSLILDICKHATKEEDLINILKWSFEFKGKINMGLLLDNLYVGEHSIKYYRYFSFEEYSPPIPATLSKKIMLQFTEEQLQNDLKLVKITFRIWFDYIIEAFTDINTPSIMEFISRNYYISDSSLKIYILDKLKSKKCIPGEYLNIKECSYPHECYIKLHDDFKGLKYLDTNLINISSDFFYKLDCKITITIEDIIKHSNVSELYDIMRIIYKYHNDIDDKYINYLEKFIVYGSVKDAQPIKIAFSEVFFPDNDLENIGLLTIIWKEHLDKNSKDYNLLLKLGVRCYPTIKEIMRYIEPATEASISYLIEHFSHYKQNLHKFKEYAFIPTDQGLKCIANCYEESTPFNYPTLDPKYKNLVTYFSIKKKPSIEIILGWIESNIGNIDKSVEKNIYEYLYTRIDDIDKLYIEKFNKIIYFRLEGDIIKKTKDVFIYTSSIKNVYGFLFHYVDYGYKGNLFLEYCGVKITPNVVDICTNLIENYTRYFKGQAIFNGCCLENVRPYISILENIYNNIDKLTPDILNKLRSLPIFVSYIIKDSSDIKSVILRNIDSIFLIDDCYLGEYFNPPSCPFIKNLEEFYELLGSKWISTSVTEKTLPNSPIYESSLSVKVSNNIQNKALLIVYDKQGRQRQNISKVEESLDYLRNIKVLYCESISRTLLFLDNKFTDYCASACLHHNILYISPFMGEIDYYDIGYCICKKIMEDKPISKNDCSDIAMILVRSLDMLRMKGYTIDKVYDCIESVEEVIPSSINLADNDKSNTDMSIIQNDTTINNTKNKPISDLNSVNDISEVVPVNNKPLSDLNSVNEISEVVPVNNNIEVVKSKTTNMESKTFTNILNNIQGQIEAVKNKSHPCNDAIIDPSVHNFMDDVSDNCEKINLDKLINVNIKGSIFNVFFEQGINSSDLEGVILEFCDIISHLLKEVFRMPNESINIFYDKGSSVVGFNSDNKIFLNARCHQELIYNEVTSTKFWFIVICHELTHNLEKSHNSRFTNIFESIILYHLDKF